MKKAETATRRHRHNESERVRMRTIAGKILEMKEMMEQTGVVVPKEKAKILTGAVEYMKHLKRTVDKAAAQFAALRHQQQMSQLSSMAPQMPVMQPRPGLGPGAVPGPGSFMVQPMPGATTTQPMMPNRANQLTAMNTGTSASATLNVPKTNTASSTPNSAMAPPMQVPARTGMHPLVSAATGATPFVAPPPVTLPFGASPIALPGKCRTWRACQLWTDPDYLGSVFHPTRASQRLNLSCGRRETPASNNTPQTTRGVADSTPSTTTTSD